MGSRRDKAGQGALGFQLRKPEGRMRGKHRVIQLWTCIVRGSREPHQMGIFLKTFRVPGNDLVPAGCRGVSCPVPSFFQPQVNFITTLTHTKEGNEVQSWGQTCSRYWSPSGNPSLVTINISKQQSWLCHGTPESCQVTKLAILLPQPPTAFDLHACHSSVAIAWLYLTRHSLHCKLWILAL